LLLDSNAEFSKEKSEPKQDLTIPGIGKGQMSRAI
jgi:hypothetical protein